jgi:hypothetical protein
MALHVLKNYFGKGQNILLCMRSGVLESISVTELQAAETHSSSELTKTKHSISRPSVVEREMRLYESALIIPFHMKKENHQNDEN